jgi:hypothetical protein
MIIDTNKFSILQSKGTKPPAPAAEAPAAKAKAKVPKKK